MTDHRHRLSDGYVSREMRVDDLEKLAEIDRRADQLFLETGISNIMAIATGPLTPLDAFSAMLTACTVTVACPSDDVPAGFIAVQRLGNDIYVRLLAVDPDHGRRGIGTSLLSLALDRGRRQGADRCILSTFRDVMFNRPYYERQGFSELPLETASALLRHQFAADIPAGIDPEQRLLMVRDL
ncbi:MAG: GNAT family N-acetyltransferase [Alphaproteobacteria bacterium]|nr:GNAT family N-acetyltransferase [Alphaproteobacteria bacterium]